MAWESVIQVYQITTNNPNMFWGFNPNVWKLWCDPGEIYHQEWRVVVCRHPVGDPRSCPSASLSRTQRRGRRRKSATVRAGDYRQRPAVRFPDETAALPSRYLRPDVRMLAATAHRTAFLPWNPPFPPAQEPWLLSHCVEKPCATEAMQKCIVYSNDERLVHHL